MNKSVKLFCLTVIALSFLSLVAAAQEPDSLSTEISIDQAIRSVGSVAELEPLLVQLAHLLRESEGEESHGWLIGLVDDLTVHQKFLVGTTDGKVLIAPDTP